MTNGVRLILSGHLRQATVKTDILVFKIVMMNVQCQNRMYFAGNVGSFHLHFTSGICFKIMSDFMHCLIPYTVG